MNLSIKQLKALIQLTNMGSTIEVLINELAKRRLGCAAGTTEKFMGTAPYHAAAFFTNPHACCGLR